VKREKNPGRTAVSKCSFGKMERQATDYVSKTLGHGAKGSRVLRNLGNRSWKCVRGGCVKAGPSRNLGDPWRAKTQERIGSGVRVTPSFG